MYSLVLMTAMTGGADAPQFNGYFRNLFNGCNGCDGGAARYSCYGGGCAGCNGCDGGCDGGAIFGVRDRVRSWWNANGCCGGTVAMAGCTGCCGGTAAYSCFGGPAMSYTPVFNGGLSCYGGPVPSAPPPVFGPAQPYPAQPYPAQPSTIPYADPTVAPPSIVPERSGLRPAGGFGPPTATVSSGSRAAIVVRLPADARLYADGVPLRLTGGERRFTTPELPAGMEFTYRMTAEYDRNGEVVSVTKRVAVRAGANETVEFADLTAARPATGAPAPMATNPATAAPAVPVSNPGPVAPVVPPVAPPAPTTPPAGDARATITVKLPAGAALYVDNNRNPSTDTTRRFTTPPLPAGREFAYLLRVEVTRNGQPEQLTQKVAFRAGEHTEVDFSTLGR
ncbi:MAG TPA: TIGR03000 domain-containing protein [Urbifossiella sp.]|nr:TIGR03000 domain-containing protein [Urbifossiella sp.]